VRATLGSVLGMSLLEGLTFKCAGRHERQLAFEFRRAIYEEEFGRLPIDNLDEVAHHLIAANSAGEIVATVRIVGPDQRPFDLEQLVDLAKFIPSERSPAMIGRLCIRSDYRTVSKRNLLPIALLKLTYELCKKLQITDLVTYAYPNLVHFYRGAFFDPMIRAFDHPIWGEVSVMRLDLDSLEVRCRESMGPLAHFLFNVKSPNILV